MNWTIDEEKLAKRVDELIEERMANKLASIKLTDDELQGIHGLIHAQIKLISELQNQDDCLKIHSAVTPLAILVSLVSKPTD